MRQQHRRGTIQYQQAGRDDSHSYQHPGVGKHVLLRLRLFSIASDDTSLPGHGFVAHPFTGRSYSPIRRIRRRSRSAKAPATPATTPAARDRPSMRGGKPVRGSPLRRSAGELRPPAVEGDRRLWAVFSDDVEMFRPANIKQFDAICFNNTLGVLFDDPELRASLLGFVDSGKGFVGIHDAIATFVRSPKYRPMARVRPDDRRDRERRTSLEWRSDDDAGGGSRQPDQRRVQGQRLSDCRSGVSASGARSSQPPACSAEHRRREDGPRAPCSYRFANRTWTFP